MKFAFSLLVVFNVAIYLQLLQGAHGMVLRGGSTKTSMSARPSHAVARPRAPMASTSTHAPALTVGQAVVTMPNAPTSMSARPSHGVASNAVARPSAPMASTQTVACCVFVIAAVAILSITASMWPSTADRCSKCSSAKKSRINTIDDARIWAIMLVIYGHFLYFNLDQSGSTHYDDSKTWLKGFQPLGWKILQFISSVRLPTVCFLSGVVSQGPVTEVRIRRFIVFLVAPTLLWTFLIKPLALGSMMHPSLAYLNTTLRNIITFNSFWNEWYLQALCFWRAGTFCLFHQLQPRFALLAMLFVSCMGGYVDFGVVHNLKLDESFGFLPYFAVGYVFPFRAVSEAFEPTRTMAVAAVLFAVVWVFTVMPMILWEPTVDGHGSYSMQGSTYNSTTGFDHSLYWTRRLCKVMLDLVPSLLLVLVATPCFMKNSCLSWAGPHTLYPFVFHEAANYWRNVAIQQFSLPVVTSTWGHVLVLLLHVVYVLVVFVALSSSYFRCLFSWCLSPAWIEVLLKRPEPAAAKQRDVDAADKVILGLPAHKSGSNYPEPHDSSTTSAGHSSEETSSDSDRSRKNSASSPESSHTHSSNKSNHSLTPKAATSTWPRRKKPFPSQSDAKKFYKYIFPGFMVCLVLTMVAYLPFLRFVVLALIMALQRSKLMWIYVAMIMAFGIVINILFYVRRCQELQRGMAPVEREEFTTTPLQHVVIVCAYKEPLEVLQRTLGSIISQEGITFKPKVVMAMEAKDPGRHATYARIEKEFGSHCHELIMTEHVLGPDEVAGKASNENFAAREVYRLLVEERGLDPFQIMLTVADADSIFAPAYLNHVEDSFWSVHDGRRLIYNGPLNVYRNLGDTDIFIGLYEMCRSHLDAFKNHTMRYTPQSNYSLTLGLAAEIDFWTPDNISEDQQTGIKAMINNYCSQTVVFVPSYICNDLVEDWGDRYTQAQRHQWGGVESLGYLFALWSSMELRAWLFLALHELKEGQIGKMYSSMLMKTSLLVTAVILMFENENRQYMILSICLVSITFLSNWICFWCSEYYTWNYILKQFPISSPSRWQWVFMVTLSPFILMLTGFIFGDLALMHCVVRAMFYDNLVYINAPKGTEKERAEVEVLAEMPSGK